MEEQIRLNKYLSTCGYCSRREADRLLGLGRVSVDGRPAGLGDKVMSGQCVCVDGEPVVKKTGRVVIAFHKPAGVVCTSSKKDKDNIVDYIGFKQRIYPVGRLDKKERT